MKQLGLAYSVQMGPYFESPAIERANGKTVAAQSSPIQPALEQGVIVAGERMRQELALRVCGMPLNTM
ncbi:Uncharacterised protein [Citrobacter youngae]|nr:hypothetical protein [Citrobacter youngae]VEI41549.1 Uncharacterised protein [Citrobacter youngae]